MARLSPTGRRSPGSHWHSGTTTEAAALGHDDQGAALAGPTRRKIVLASSTARHPATDGRLVKVCDAYGTAQFAAMRTAVIVLAWRRDSVRTPLGTAEGDQSVSAPANSGIEGGDTTPAAT